MSGMVESVTITTTIVISLSLPGPRLTTLSLSVNEATELWEELGKVLGKDRPIDYTRYPIVEPGRTYRTEPGYTYDLRDTQNTEVKK